MNREIIKRWNDVAENDDHITHLGDFALVSANPDIVADFVSRLNGSITLLLGNHDKKSPEWWSNVGIFDVRKGSFTEDGYVFSHAPIPSEQMKYSKLINVHGHTHKFLIKDGKHVCVCVEYTDYTPILISDIPNFLKRQGG